MAIYPIPSFSTLSASRLTSQLDAFPLTSLTATEINAAYGIRDSYNAHSVNSDTGEATSSEAYIVYSSPYLFKVVNDPDNPNYASRFANLSERSIFLGYIGNKAYGIFQVVKAPDSVNTSKEKYVRAYSYDDLLPTYFDMELSVLQGTVSNEGINRFVTTSDDAIYAKEKRSADLRFNDDSRVSLMGIYLEEKGQ